MSQERYSARGVSAGKEEVHKAIKNMDKGLYPLAFCKILPDIVGHDSEMCNIMHADTAGSKPSLAYLYWKETGDVSVWKGIVQDSLVMNLDDMACVGCIQDIVISSTIGRNSKYIDGEVLSTLIQASGDFLDKLRSFDIKISHAGGETADVGDIVRTVDVGFTTFGRMPRKDLIINDIQDGDVIVGFASFGQATYEEEYNGGMGSNGLTSARHDVLDHEYASKYPESYEPLIDKELVYSGSKKLTDQIDIEGESIPVGKLILSPTRSYIPIIKEILDHHREHIHGMIHCTGGAQTKVIKFIQNKHIIKDQLFEDVPLFDLIQKESNTSWQEMYKVFNMGHRLEVYCPKEIAQSLIDISAKFNVDAKIIGRVEESSANKVSILSKHGEFEYE